MANVQITPPPISPQAMADLLCTIMLLVRGADGNGRDFWAYVCIKPSMAQSFREARDRGVFDLEDYGTIIETGGGHTVPMDIEERMVRDYGVNPHYEEDLLKAVAEAHS